MWRYIETRASGVFTVNRTTLKPVEDNANHEAEILPMLRPSIISCKGENITAYDCILISKVATTSEELYALEIPQKWRDKLNGREVLFDVLFPVSLEEGARLRIQREKLNEIITQRKTEIVNRCDTVILANSLIASIAYDGLWLKVDLNGYTDGFTRVEDETRRGYILNDLIQILDKKLQKERLTTAAQPYLEHLKNTDTAAFDEVNAFIDDVLKEVCTTKHLAKDVRDAIRAYKQRLRRQQQPKQDKPKKQVRKAEHNDEEIELPNSLEWHMTRAIYTHKGKLEEYKGQLQSTGYKVQLAIGVDEKGKENPNSITFKIQRPGYFLAVHFDDCYSLLTTHYLRAGRLLDLILAQCIKQNAIYHGKIIKDELKMFATEVMKYFQYTDEKALEKDFEQIAIPLRKMGIYAKEKYKRSKKQETAPFFTLIRLEKGELTVKLNKDAPWDIFFAFIAPYPAFFFELHADAYNLLSNCLYYARTNAPQLRQDSDGLYIDISLQNVADYMGLPAVKGAINAYRDTVKRILDAVDEIHRTDGGKKEIVEGLEVETLPNNIAITCPKYVKGRGEGATKPGEWMREKLRLHIRGDLGAKYLVYKTRQIEAEVKARKRKEDNENKAMQKAIAEKLKDKITIERKPKATQTA